MKLTIILITIACLQVSAATYAQKITLSAQDVSLVKALQSIKKQSGYAIFYDNTLLKQAGNTTVYIKNASVDEALAEVLKDEPFTFTIIDKTIVIKEKRASLLDEIKTALVIAVTVSGRVTDSLNVPLVGASVINKTTNKAVLTNDKGEFTFTAQANDIVTITFIGYNPYTFTVTQSLTFQNIVLHGSFNKLNEVVVNTGYQLIKAEQSTGAISRIGTKDYESQINTNFLSGLVNKLPGLLIDNDIKFIGNNLFQIRGISTINGNKQPLIVIDGFPTELTLDMINPNEIESVTILKDAAAAAIYGARSSNGVIVIERKKAKAGKVLVNFRATTGYTPKENYDRYRWDKDASNTDIALNKIYYANSINANTWGIITSVNNGGSFNFNPKPYFILAQQAAGLITADQANQQFTALGSYNNAKDYSRLFLRTASIQTYNLDLSGGSDNALYYITANYNNSDATQIKTGNNLFQLSGRTTLKFSKSFSLDLTTDFTESNAASVPIPDITNFYPYERFQDDNGNPLPTQNGSNASTYYNNALLGLGFQDNLYYPLVDFNEISNKTHTLNNRTTANFHYNVGNGFKFNFGGVYETSSTDTKHLASANSSEAHQYINNYTNITTGVFNIPKGGDLKQSTASLQSYTLRAQLNYDKHISKDHSLNAIFGGEVRDVINQGNSEAYFGYDNQTLLSQAVDYNIVNSFFNNYTISNPVVSYPSLFSQTYAENRYVSAYSNLVYSYKGKYSLTGSLRIDQSDLFGTDPKYRYKPLWSVGAAWNIREEAFMHDVSWVNSLKLRIAEGFNGNVAKNALPEVIAANGINTLTSGVNIPQLTLRTLANSGLRWEQTLNYNIGIDYNIFKNISGSIDYYIKKSTDILASSSIDASKGAASAITNNASIRNNGLEVRLNADWITRKKFNWNTGIVLSHNTSKVLQVYNTNITPNNTAASYLSSGASNYVAGYAVGAIFNYRYAGLDPTGQLLVYDQTGAKRLITSTTDPTYLDYAGSSIPANNAGLSNRVDIGDFYVYCMINYYGGFKIRVPVPDPLAAWPLVGAGNYWKQAGDENIPDILPSPLNSNNVQYTDKYTVNGDYFTLGYITTSYSLRHSKLVKKIGLSDFEVKLQGSNLYTVALNKYNYSVATGSYAKSYLTPTYTIGINATF